MMGRFYRSLLGRLKPGPKKVLKFNKFASGNYPKFSVFKSSTEFFIYCSLLSFLILVGCSYFYMFSSSTLVVNNQNRGSSNSSSSTEFLSKGCNVFHGTWVNDESYPLYNASECPFSERGFNCLANGREDERYLKWRWKPKGCEIPRFDAHSVLEFLRGKRVIFVGDSLSRTQWESMICMLMSGVDDKKSVYEVNGNEITKLSRHLSVRFDTFRLTIEFYRSVFLVRPGLVPKNSPKRVRRVVKLDQMDAISREWIDSDILIFNSGHWWTPTKLFEMGWYFQVRGRIKLGMTISSALKIALSTWRSWIEKSVNPTRTQVFFRTFESTHWSSGSRQNCNVTQQPSGDPQNSPISDAIIQTVKDAAIPVQLLHVTPMSAFRSDAHVGSWSDNPSVPDCSHWCLPGVPDMWNELLFALLLSK